MPIEIEEAADESSGKPSFSAGEAVTEGLVQGATSTGKPVRVRKKPVAWTIPAESKGSSYPPPYAPARVEVRYFISQFLPIHDDTSTNRVNFCVNFWGV